METFSWADTISLTKPAGIYALQQQFRCTYGALAVLAFDDSGCWSGNRAPAVAVVASRGQIYRRLFIGRNRETLTIGAVRPFVVLGDIKKLFPLLSNWQEIAGGYNNSDVWGNEGSGAIYGVGKASNSSGRQDTARRSYVVLVVT